MKLVFYKGIPIIISRIFFSFVNKFFGVNIQALTLFPLIVINTSQIIKQKDYMNHEMIHMRQYIETGIIGLIIIGIMQYLYARWFLKKTKTQAYYFMSHEQEAHQHDQDLQYLKNRKWFSYYKYLLPQNRKSIDSINGQRVIFEDFV